ncbi:hypothetical protein WT01_15685 [Burkholderia cepacia]|uniref:hypothetical protein n=1 Tax=Burkholderia cepacia TaxID=292 RepID=UPI00075BA3BF|nr:hypothetical protein [Burkholderia cepacia]KVL59268.1 hypothetical protein WT01_15685 [Burkholderia cepacia]
MLEWLKRLVARRELEELDRWRVECVEARRWFAEFPEVAHALDYLSGFAKGTHGGRIDQARERMRNIRAFVEPIRVPPEHADPAWIDHFAAEWRAASHEWAQPCRWVPPEPERDAAPREQGVDYRFLGMTGEEDS